MSKITVIGAIVSKNGVTIFQNTGESSVLAMDSYRTQAILDATLPLIAKIGKAEIDLENFKVELKENVANANVKVSDDLSSIKVKTQAGGEVDVAKALKPQVERATVSKSAAKALKAFTTALSRVKRQHSAEELMKFITRHDLPLAEDGAIIGFKTLNSVRDDPGVFVDGHTRKVRQRLGSYVYMDVKDVNESRRQDCGTGLHIMSRSYNYSGDVTCLVKIRPQDVIAVPISETNKMRVAAYHIVAVLNAETRAKISSAKDFRADGSIDALKKVVVGDHPGILERVWVGKQGQTKAELIVGKQKARRVVETDDSFNPLPSSKVDPQKARQQIRDARATIKAAESGDLSVGLARALETGSKRQYAETVQTPISALPEDDTTPIVYFAGDTFERKLEKAFILKQRHHSIREIAKILKMDRETLSKKFKEPQPAAASSKEENVVLNPVDLTPVDMDKVTMKITKRRIEVNTNPNAAYDEKLAQAHLRYAAGQSIRTIAKELKMDRETLGKKLKG